MFDVEFLKIMMTIEFRKPSSSKKVQDTGRKRVIPLFVVPCVKESHGALHGMFKMLEFPDCHDYNLSPDLKALNLALGLSTCSSLHPCALCTFNSSHP